MTISVPCSAVLPSLVLRPARAAHAGGIDRQTARAGRSAGAMRAAGFARARALKRASLQIAAKPLSSALPAAIAPRCGLQLSTAGQAWQRP